MGHQIHHFKPICQPPGWKSQTLLATVLWFCIPEYTTPSVMFFGGPIIHCSCCGKTGLQEVKGSDKHETLCWSATYIYTYCSPWSSPPYLARSPPPFLQPWLHSVQPHAAVETHKDALNWNRLTSKPTSTPEPSLWPRPTDETTAFTLHYKAIMIKILLLCTC